MESDGQTTQSAKPARDTTARDGDEPRRQLVAAQGTARDSRVTEPAVATDGQLVEAGYGHGV